MRKEKTLTEMIWDKLDEGATPDDLQEMFRPDCSFADYINSYISSHPGLTAAKIIQNADIPRSYGNEILTGKKKGTRDRIIAICFGAGMNIDELNHSLTYSGFGNIYPTQKRDGCIAFAFKNRKKVATITDLNLYLTEKNQEPLHLSKD